MNFETDLEKIKLIAERNTLKSLKMSLRDTMQEISCKHIKEVNQEVHVIFENITMSLMHNKYNQVLYKVESSQIEVDYLSYYDHIKFGVKLKDALFVELTGYPYTINPSYNNHK